MKHTIMILLVAFASSFFISDACMAASKSSVKQYKAKKSYVAKAKHKAKKQKYKSKVTSGVRRSYSGSSSKRDPAVRRAFHAKNPCPSTGKRRGACPGYHVDHVIPLACGGADATYNMQWLTAAQNLSKGSMGCRY